MRVFNSAAGTWRVTDLGKRWFRERADQTSEIVMQLPVKFYTTKNATNAPVVHLGWFHSPEEAALCRARTPEGQLACKKAEADEAQGGFMSSHEAKEQAEAEGLTLQPAANQTGYANVWIDRTSYVRPFVARVVRDGKKATLGHFATPEAAALKVARARAEGAV